MAIRMQGAWTLQVQSRNENEGYRFIVTGADIGNGVHDGAPGKMIFVRGTHWAITLQRKTPRGGPWTEIDHRIGETSVGHGLVEFDIRAHDQRDAEPGLVLVCMRLAGKLELARRNPARGVPAYA